MENRGTILTLRIAAGIVAVAALFAFIEQFRVPHTASSVAAGVGLLVVGLGVGVGLFAISALYELRQSGPAEILRNVTRLQQQMAELTGKINDAGLSLDRLSRTRSPGTEPVAPAPPPPSAVSPQLLGAIDDLRRQLTDLRELALLTDDQRRDRAFNLRDERKLARVRQALEMIESHRWSDAERLLNAAETETPGDATVQGARKQLESARAGLEADAVAVAEHQIESEMSLSHWDNALAMSQKLVADFPASEGAKNLLARVQREREVFTDSTVHRLYEEIRHDIERRVWRRALSHAERLLEQFPDHPRSERIRMQLATIQDNAEIEERQEQEVQIQELIRSHRFQEAIQLSEDLLRRFPLSPQAEAIELLLPRIHQLAQEAQSGGSAVSPT